MFPTRGSNQLIAALGAADREALLAATTPVAFRLGEIFAEPGDLVEDLHFVESGIISAVAIMQDGRSVETYMVGPEGMTGICSFAVSIPVYTRLVAQSSGTARRIAADDLRVLAEARPGLRQVLASYAARLKRELEQSSACNALHRSDQRFAKWLLRCHDRLDGDDLMLTQEYLASMLGSQRTTVNEAAQQLQRAGAIAYSRGRVRITDRSALERAACECYSLWPAPLRKAVPA
ncbi:MAG TPA: Crp/Fnr family transcriptional regulator [Brevundimonas sp.]|jgi:CRP-like cAMP-binding protein|uniref:Crp/Fnr family transcriptional regulator n=1 Tax=Brevundimonas sp. TaxID=1871086 RepID=UPI002E140B89|nr:Crp/Fnr family transcriptional regulator [Brevundimonas sp.]